MILFQHLDVEDVSLDLRLRTIGLTKERCDQLYHFMDVIVKALEEDVGTECVWLATSSSNFDLFEEKSFCMQTD